MDPNANLHAQEDLLLLEETCDMPDKTDLLHELADLRLSLFAWIQKGGFEPDWSACPKASVFYGH